MNERIRSLFQQNNICINEIQLFGTIIFSSNDDCELLTIKVHFYIKELQKVSFFISFSNILAKVGSKLIFIYFKNIGGF